MTDPTLALIVTTFTAVCFALGYSTRWLIEKVSAAKS